MIPAGTNDDRVDIEIQNLEEGKSDNKSRSESGSESGSNYSNSSSPDEDGVNDDPFFNAEIEPKTERQILRDQLLALFFDIFENRMQYPIEVEVKKQNCIVRRKGGPSSGFAAGVDQFILERTDSGVTPAQFMKLLNKQELFVRSNKMCKKYELINQEF